MKKQYLLLLILPLLTSCSGTDFPYKDNFVYSSSSSVCYRKNSLSASDIISEQSDLFSKTSELAGYGILGQINSRTTVIYASAVDGGVCNNILAAYDVYDRDFNVVFRKTNTELQNDSEVGESVQIWFSPVIEYSSGDGYTPILLTYSSGNKETVSPLQIVLNSDASVLYYGKYDSSYVNSEGISFGDYSLEINQYTKRIEKIADADGNEAQIKTAGVTGLSGDVTATLTDSRLLYLDGQIFVAANVKISGSYGSAVFTLNDDLSLNYYSGSKYSLYGLTGIYSK